MTDDQAGSAFRFHGSWREFAPIALTNLLLIIVTLGIYRFWAKARERRYLWSRTDFIGDPLEWTGTGKELFIGFVLAILLFGVPLVLIQFLLQMMVMRGAVALAPLVGLVFTSSILFVVGVARFRALRYRLSRTLWHGIRGGSDEKGFAYGWSYVWKSIVGGFFFGLMLPWSMIDLWNQRWNSMSFGSHSFTAGAEFGPLLKRLLICYGLIILLITALSLLIAISDSFGPTMVVIAVIMVLFIPALLVVFLIYYALFLRLAINGMTLNRIDFAFTARSFDLAKLILGDLLLIVGTLGLGFVFLSYRHWAFFIRHMEASGEIDLGALRQSLTEEPRQGEGLLDAFDVGAF